MLSRYFKSKSEKGSKKKRDKEISVIVEDVQSQETCNVQVRQSLLTEHSEIFKRMAAEGDFKKRRKLKLDSVSILALQKIVEYIENSTASFKNHYEVLETLKGAHKYQIKSVEKICVNHLITSLDVNNVCEIYEFASGFSYNDLEYQCLKLIDLKAEAVLKSPGFLMLPKQTVKDILKRNSLKVHSEMAVLDMVLSWGLNECFKLGLDSEKSSEFIPIVRSLLTNVRFLAMTAEELRDSKVKEYYTLLTSDVTGRTRTPSQSSRSSVAEPLTPQPRVYVKEYIHNLEAYELLQPPVKNGELFSLRLEVVKGKIFLTSINLALVTFAATKSTAGLCVVLSASNVFTMDQETVRGTFLNTRDEASMVFPRPLAVRESERVEVTLHVKRAENISPLVIKNDVQIVVPESKDVALKITPSDTRQEIIRCIFKEIVYFY